MIEEQWKQIPAFPWYNVSNLGRIYNIRFDSFMSISYTKEGYAKITLMDESHRRHTRSVSHFVAEAFVLPPNALCDHVVVLSGDFSDVRAENLVWRPRWFAWKYAHQLKQDHPLHFRNLQVANLNTDTIYESILTAGKAEGLLLSDIWRSTYTGSRVYPYGHVFEIVERV